MLLHHRFNNVCSIADHKSVCWTRTIRYSVYGRVNISRDLLPCHLTNGADISGYIIQYSSPSDNERNISTSDKLLEEVCHSERDHRYTCLLSQTSRLLQNGVTYTFRVAARNRYEVGPFSEPVFGMIDITSIVINCCYYGKYCGCHNCVCRYYLYQ